MIERRSGKNKATNVLCTEKTSHIPVKGYIIILAPRFIHAYISHEKQTIMPCQWYPSLLYQHLSNTHLHYAEKEEKKSSPMGINKGTMD